MKAIGCLAVLLAAGCANLPADLGAAEEAHRRAVINARTGNLGPEREAMALHNLALVKRDLCKLADAEELLRQAYQIRSGSGDTPPEHLAGTIFELAQLHYEQRRYADAATLMERGFPLLEKFNVERTEPAAFAHILLEYVDALRMLHRTGEADAAQARLNALVSAHGIDLERKPQRAPFNHPACR